MVSFYSRSVLSLVDSNLLLVNDLLPDFLQFKLLRPFGNVGAIQRFALPIQNSGNVAKVFGRFPFLRLATIP